MEPPWRILHRNSTFPRSFGSKFILSLLLLVNLFNFVESAAKNKKLGCKRTAFNRRTTNYLAWKEQMTACELLENYDPAVRPFGTVPHMEKNGPVVVATGINIRSISAVNVRNMEYVVQFRFQQRWYDERLRFDQRHEFRNLEVINFAQDQQPWIPDTFFQNERNGWYHMLDQENRFVKIRKDGLVTYDRRLTLTLSCDMNLIRYPMDTQECFIDFASYAYTTKDIIYDWSEIGITLSPTANGALPNFEIVKVKNATCDSVTNTGTYSCLRVQLTLKRVFSFFLLQLYIPSAMLVAVSWVSYWIDWKSTAARVPLAIVTLLTMITTSHAINSNLPPVSYAKSIDIWIGGCVVFIFASLIEYSFVNYLGILDENKQMHKVTMNKTRLSNVVDSNIQNIAPQKKKLFGANAKRSILRKRRKVQLNMHYGDSDSDIELRRMEGPTSRDILNNNEPDWTMHDIGDLVYQGQRKRVELIRWCSLLSERGRAERIDIIARVLFPAAFIMFNIVYWSVYLGEDPNFPSDPDFELIKS
ncbi:unnamed protein product [Bursaphelenchus xylophilus]|uniref:(pine wood nematode) hypothetical protein n=1 Tax=Bursaphelenchus xylophilus TaxID=6326 RepID=A0A1I7SEB5_BURXY|nr:unnamed protein product [Bursaphelenchus xylophilus]CAG9087430.1 unnamed protein product [Bursaphelenchus xylophilus]